MTVLSIVSADAATIAHYKFQSSSTDQPLYELTDSSGNAHHGRVIGQEPFELTSDIPPYPGATGGALDARGRNDYAIVPHHPDFAFSGDWTIEFFIKPAFFHQEHGGATNIAGPFRPYINTNLSFTIMAKPNTNEPTQFGSAWAFHYQPTTGWVVFTISYGADDGETLLVSKDLRDGQWHHIAIVFRTSIENEIRLYIDGLSTTSINQHGGNIPISWGTGPIYVGAFARQNQSNSVQDRNFDGFLDEMRFSDAALTTETFVVNFAPFLFPPIDVEVHAATEIQFPTQAAKVYRIEESRADTGAWVTLGYSLGDEATKSFYHRDQSRPVSSYRVSLAFTGQDPATIIHAAGRQLCRARGKLAGLWFAGPGKSHFVAALSRELILRHGHTVLFTPAFKLVQQLLNAKKALKLEALLKKLDRYAVVCLDDIGYVQQDREEMEVLFTFLAERYERRSVMITSNLVFSKWDQIFKDPMTTMAAIDRLVHHATILEFDGESVRAKKAKARSIS